MSSYSVEAGQSSLFDRFLTMLPPGLAKIVGDLRLLLSWDLR